MRLLGLVALLVSTPPAVRSVGNENFDAVKTGAQLPTAWRCGVSGHGEPQWSVAQDATAPSKPNGLKQSGQGDFPWCVLDHSELGDGFVEARLKQVGGEEDQAGGVVFRWKGAGDYYIARANALENDVALFRMQNNERRLIKNVELEVKAGIWHHLRVDFIGSRFTVTFDGKRVLDAEDGQLTGVGAVGVWTKADSVTIFDNFAFGARQARRSATENR
jgi:hypothetical protein